MRETVKKGKTVEEALNLALQELGISEDEADIKILNEGNKGLFGLIGNKEAEVMVTAKETAGTETASESKKLAREFLQGVFEKMNVDADITIVEIDNKLDINLSGDNMGILIGRRGETLMALQYLTSLTVNRKKEGYIGVTIDTENYKKKREETLIKLARKTADKAIKYRRNMTLEPMNPYERRIIHASLQDDDRIKTYSTGEEPNRKVVISYNRGSKD